MAEIMKQIAEQEEQERRPKQGGRPAPAFPQNNLAKNLKPISESQEMADIMNQIAEQEAKDQASRQTASRTPQPQSKPITESQEMAEIMKQIAEQEAKDQAS